MRKNWFVFSIILFVIFNLYPKESGAYGWGFKKNTDGKIPDIGKYEKILDDHSVFYADKQTKNDIYLTFDNGYEAGYTTDILDILLEEDVPATFFVTGHYVEQEPKLIKRMVEDGHIIGNHSYHHPDFTSMSKKEIEEELQLVEDAISDVTDYDEMKYVRPPRGTFNNQTLKWSSELGYISVFWSLAFKDWEKNRQQGEQYAFDNIMEQVHPGAIILLHTVSEDNAEALEKVIQQLKKDGYTFKSLDDLLWKELIDQDILF